MKRFSVWRRSQFFLELRIVVISSESWFCSERTYFSRSARDAADAPLISPWISLIVPDLGSVSESPDGGDSLISNSHGARVR